MKLTKKLMTCKIKRVGNRRQDLSAEIMGHTIGGWKFRKHCYEALMIVVLVLKTDGVLLEVSGEASTNRTKYFPRK